MLNAVEDAAARDTRKLRELKGAWKAWVLPTSSAKMEDARNFMITMPNGRLLDRSDTCRSETPYAVSTVRRVFFTWSYIVFSR